MFRMFRKGLASCASRVSDKVSGDLACMPAGKPVISCWLLSVKLSALLCDYLGATACVHWYKERLCRSFLRCSSGRGPVFLKSACKSDCLPLVLQETGYDISGDDGDALVGK